MFGYGTTVCKGWFIEGVLLNSHLSKAIFLNDSFI